jgi:HD-GYP domain-containing protein (c-di-GMP phosphodiesterase class II)
MSGIYRKILKRLLIAWIGISLTAGAAVFYIGIERIDDQLVELAVAESGKLAGSALPLLNRPAAERAPLAALTGDFVRQHFIVVELYDRERRKVAEAINPRHAAVEDELKRHTHAFPRDDERHYEKFVIGDQTVLRVLLPMKDAAGAIAGFFEGVFVIAPETLERLRSELGIALAVVLCAVLLTTVSLYPVILALNRDVVRYSHDLLKGNIELMEVLGSAIAKRDSDTNIHNYRVTIYAVRLAEAAGVAGRDIHDLIAGAFLHDVGKIGISDNILLKPARLDASEFGVMKTHVALGVDILMKSDWLQRARDVVEFHHEKFDGSGYLRGLAGEAIPLTARIFAIVDVFDALTSKRPYKEPMPFAEAMAIVKGYAGNHFDPRLVQTFAGMIEPLFREVSEASDGEVEQMLRSLIERYLLAKAQA